MCKKITMHIFFWKVFLMISKQKIFFLIFLPYLLSIISCAESKQCAQEQIEILTKTGNSITVQVEIAYTEEEKAKGFMNRTTIPDGTGMVFSYQKDQILRFWMKNTPHPLSIAFIDGQGCIKQIADMHPYSLETIASVHLVRYALEVPQGWFLKTGICVGDCLSKESIEKIRWK